MELITVTPVLSASTYTDGNALGEALQFHGTSSEVGLVHSLTLIDTDLQNVDVDLVLFRDDFTATADNSPFTVDSADQEKVLGVVPIREYSSLGSISVGMAQRLSLPFENRGNKTTLHGQLVIRGNATFSTPDSLTLTLGVLNGGQY